MTESRAARIARLRRVYEGAAEIAVASALSGGSPKETQGWVKETNRAFREYLRALRK